MDRLDGHPEPRLEMSHLDIYIPSNNGLLSMENLDDDRDIVLPPFTVLSFKIIREYDEYLPLRLYHMK